MATCCREFTQTPVPSSSCVWCIYKVHKRNLAKTSFRPFIYTINSLYTSQVPCSTDFSRCEVTGALGKPSLQFDLFCFDFFIFHPSLVVVLANKRRSYSRLQLQLQCRLRVRPVVAVVVAQRVLQRERRRRPWRRRRVRRRAPLRGCRK